MNSWIENRITYINMFSFLLLHWCQPSSFLWGMPLPLSLLLWALSVCLLSYFFLLRYFPHISLLFSGFSSYCSLLLCYSFSFSSSVISLPTGQYREEKATGKGVNIVSPWAFHPLSSNTAWKEDSLPSLGLGQAELSPFSSPLPSLTGQAGLGINWL